MSPRHIVNVIALTSLGFGIASFDSAALAVGPCPCLTDFNTDGVTDAADLAILLGAWGNGPGDTDLNDDNIVDAVDLGILLGAWGPCAPPPNDSCGNAIVVSGATVVTPFCTAAATTSTPPVPGSCDIGAPVIGKDIWYRYTTAYAGSLIVHTCQASYDTMLAVYGSTIPGLCACPSNGIGFASLRACNDDDPSCGFSSFVEFPVGADECFNIRVGGYTAGNGDVDEGFGDLSIHLIKQGDRCDLAHQLPSLIHQEVAGTNAGDTWVQADQSSCANGDTFDEWYRFEMPCSGTVSFDTCNPGTNYDTTIAVFSGCNGGEIDCNDDSRLPGCQLRGLNRKSFVSINANGGEVIYIRVSGFNGATGDFVLTIDADCIG